MKLAPIPSRSKPDTSYEIVLGDGEVTCNCVGFAYRRHCYHSDAALAFMQALASGSRKKSKVTACPRPRHATEQAEGGLGKGGLGE